MLRSPWLFPGLLLLALALRLQGLNWDEGRALHPDEGNLVRAAVGLAWPDKLIPQFHAYNDLAIWLPKLAAVPFCDVSTDHCLRMTSRVISALFSVAAVWAMAGVALRLAGPGAMVATALVAGASAPLIQWAHFGTTESAILFLVAALWLQAARWLRGEVTTARMAFWSALLIGLGFGLKTTSVVLSVIPVTALVLQGRPDALRLKALAWAIPLAAILALASTPSLIFATEDWLATMRFENGVVQGTTPVFWTRQFLADTGPLYQMRQLWGATEGAGLLLALAGIVLLARSGWRLVLPGLAFALVYAGLTFGWHAAFFRYLSPLFPVVLVLAGVGAARLVESVPSRFATAAACLGLGLIVLNGLDLAASYQSREPRVLAEEDLVRRAMPGDLVAIEPYDTPLTGGLETVILPLDGADVMAIADPLSRADWLLVASRRNWGVLPYTTLLACTYYTALVRGELGFRPVATFRRSSPFGPMLEPGMSGEETRTVFDRPTLVLLRNDLRLDAGTLAGRIAAPPDPAACTPKALAAAWTRPQ